jgi:hypothetical protein
MSEYNLPRIVIPTQAAGHWHSGIIWQRR